MISQQEAAELRSLEEVLAVVRWLGHGEDARPLTRLRHLGLNKLRLQRHSSLRIDLDRMVKIDVVLFSRVLGDARRVDLAACRL